MKIDKIWLFYHTKQGIIMNVVAPVNFWLYFKMLGMHLTATNGDLLLISNYPDPSIKHHAHIPNVKHLLQNSEIWV